MGYQWPDSEQSEWSETTGSLICSLEQNPPSFWHGIWGEAQSRDCPDSTSRTFQGNGNTKGHNLLFYFPVDKSLQSCFQLFLCLNYNFHFPNVIDLSGDKVLVFWLERQMSGEEHKVRQQVVGGWLIAELSPPHPHSHPTPGKDQVGLSDRTAVMRSREKTSPCLQGVHDFCWGNSLFLSYYSLFIIRRKGGVETPEGLFF